MSMSQLTKLENGLRVVTHTIKDFSSVVMGYWVEAGGSCEDKEVCGISHFLEHMAFKGTNSRTAQQIAEAIESVGGYLNAYTGKETTAFYAKILGKNSNIALDIISDILQNPIFDKSELERERQVILQEISQTYDAPEDIIFDYFQAVAFPNQSLGRPILGPSDIVAKISADDLRQYRRRYYNADNMVFAAVGNVCHDQIIEEADRYFSKFSTNKTIKHNDTYKYVGGFFSDQRKLEQTHIILGFNGVSCTDPDYYNLAVFSSILGGGMSSRLFQEIREKRGLVYSIYTFSSAYKNNGLFGIYAATSGHKIQELTEVAIAELLSMENNITEDEFNRVKAQFESALLMSRENNHTLCEQIVNQIMIFGHTLSNEEIMAKIDAVTIDSVKAMLQKILSKGISVTTVGNIDANVLIPVVEKYHIRHA